VQRVAGAERIATSIAISTADFEAAEAGAVVLTRADAFPDALAGTPLAVQEDAPLLLTFPETLDAAPTGRAEGGTGQHHLVRASVG
jgi:hypothetical protein